MADEKSITQEVAEKYADSVKGIGSDALESAFISVMDDYYKKELKNLGADGKTLAAAYKIIKDGDWDNKRVSTSIDAICALIDNAPAYKIFRESKAYSAYRSFKTNWSSYGVYIYNIKNDLEDIAKYQNADGTIRMNTEVINALQDACNQFIPVVKNLIGLVPGGKIMNSIFDCIQTSVQEAIKVEKEYVYKIIGSDLTAAYEGTILGGSGYGDIPGLEKYTAEYLIEKIIAPDSPTDEWADGPSLDELNTMLPYLQDEIGSKDTSYFEPYIEWRTFYEMKLAIQNETGINMFEDTRTPWEKIADTWDDHKIKAIGMLINQIDENNKKTREECEEIIYQKLEKWGVVDWVCNTYDSAEEKAKKAKEDVIDWIDGISISFDNKMGEMADVIYGDGGGFWQMYKAGWQSILDVFSINHEFDNAAGAVVDPLIIDTENDGFNIESKSEGAYFDLNAEMTESFNLNPLVLIVTKASFFASNTVFKTLLRLSISKNGSPPVIPILLIRPFLSRYCITYFSFS